jgi:predicted nucleic acid-binding protein
MRFWDSSAVIPLLIREASSAELRALLASDMQIVAALITPIEVRSALWRRRHHNELSAENHAAAEEAFEELDESWVEVADIFDAREIALDLITRHVLRSGDALQLASALIACAFDPASLPFVTLDIDLASAARVEGFTVLP